MRRNAPYAEPLSELDEFKEIPSLHDGIYLINDNIPTVQINHRYDLNIFVSIRAKEGEAGPAVWIGKLLKTMENREGIVKSLNVHWFERNSASAWLAAMY